MTKILVDKAVIEQALEALNATMATHGKREWIEDAKQQANAALRSALEQPKREPLTDADLGVYVSKELADYTAGAYADYGCAKDQLIHFARAIERAHGIGGEV